MPYNEQPRMQRPSPKRNRARRALQCLCFLAATAAAHLVAAQAATQNIIIPAPPEIGAQSYLLIDPLSNTVLVEHNADKPLGPASITKMMTAYLTYKALRRGQISLDEEVIVSEKAWRMKGSRTFFEVGKPCLLYTSPSPRDATLSRMPSSA